MFPLHIKWETHIKNTHVKYKLTHRQVRDAHDYTKDLSANTVAASAASLT